MTISPIKSIVDSYENVAIKSYSRIRFTILRQPFLEEIDQWLPVDGRVLDLGSGFGLFSLYFAMTHPGRRVTGVDLSAKRVLEAKASASRLGLSNVEYHVADVLEWEPPCGGFDAIYMLDVVHHLPRADVPEFLRRVVSRLAPGGMLIVKDVSHKPIWKMLFTLALDRLMVGMAPISYWSPRELASILEGLGMDVKRHTMNDILPYPHVLFICRRHDPVPATKNG